MQITEGVISILSALLLTPCSTGQLANLHSKSRKKCSEKMKALYDLGLVRRFQQPFIEKRGKGEYIYFLSKKGSAILGANNGKRSYHLINPLKNIYSLPHTLAITDLNIALTQGGAPGFLCRFYYPRQLNIQASDFEGVLPDGSAVIEHKASHKKILHFLEVDLSTESLASDKSYSVKHKLDKYYRLLENEDASKILTDKFGYTFNGFRVLFVLSSHERLNSLIDLAETADAEFIWCGTKELLHNGHIYDPAWCNYKHEKLSLTGRYPIR